VTRSLRFLGAIKCEKLTSNVYEAALPVFSYCIAHVYFVPIHHSPENLFVSLLTFFVHCVHPALEVHWVKDVAHCRVSHESALKLLLVCDLDVLDPVFLRGADARVDLHVLSGLQEVYLLYTYFTVQFQ